MSATVFNFFKILHLLIPLRNIGITLGIFENDEAELNIFELF